MELWGIGSNFKTMFSCNSLFVHGDPYVKVFWGETSYISIHGRVEVFFSRTFAFCACRFIY